MTRLAFPVHHLLGPLSRLFTASSHRQAAKCGDGSIVRATTVTPSSDQVNSNAAANAGTPNEPKSSTNTATKASAPDVGTKAAASTDTSAAMAASGPSASAVFFAQPHLRDATFAHQAERIEQREREKERNEWVEQRLREAAGDPSVYVAIRTFKPASVGGDGDGSGGKLVVVSEKTSRDRRFQPGYEEGKKEAKVEESKEVVVVKEMQEQEKGLDEVKNEESEGEGDSRAAKVKRAIKRQRTKLVGKMRSLCKRG